MYIYSINYTKQIIITKTQLALDQYDIMTHLLWSSKSDLGMKLDFIK